MASDSQDQPPTFFHKINDFPLIYGNNQGKTSKNTKKPLKKAKKCLKNCGGCAKHMISK